MSTSVPLFRLLILTLLLSAGLSAPASETKYTDRGKADFDRVLQVLNPYGTWSKIGGRWAYTPLDHYAPYTNGRWIYTEFGWYWKGNAPYSWATDHYGFWKRDANKVWSWYPGPYWLPVIVEIRQTPTHFGWRSAEVDQDGTYVEAPEDRYAKTDEWSFVTREQFTGPITPKILADPDTAMRQLVNSTDCRHTYFTYRELDRPGPHPADVAALCKDGGMLAPKTLEDQLAAQQAEVPTPAPAIPTVTGTMPATNAPDYHAYAAKMTGVAKPALVGSNDEPVTDKRKVKYWITMSLPTYWTKPPTDAKPEEVYFYRPDFYQDDDGIQRRITLWFNPQARTSLKDILGGHLPGAASSNPGNGTPATPAEPAKPVHAFSSPLDAPYRPNSGSNGSSSKNPQAPAPTGLINEQAPASTTNAAPDKP